MAHIRSKKQLADLIKKHGYRQRKYISPGFCWSCVPQDQHSEYFGLTIGGHEEKFCRNPPFCWAHGVAGHFATYKCSRFCNHCFEFGHSMQVCRKIKDCVLCGKPGHNPFRCWEYSTIKLWMKRAKELNRCAECLTLYTMETNQCTHCYTERVYWDPWRPNKWEKESQTETYNCKNQEAQTELEQAQAIIENQKSQINECNNEIAILESKLEHYVSANDSLNSQLQNTTEEKEHALLKLDSLQLVYHERDVELVDARAAVEKLQEEVGKKELQLEQYNISNAQS